MFPNLQKDRVRTAIKEAGRRRYIYKRSEMAEYLGYSASYFSSLMNSHNIPDLFLKRLVEKLGINPGWILNGNGDMFLSKSKPGLDYVGDRLFYLISEVYKTNPLAFSSRYHDPKGVKTYNILNDRNGISKQMLEMIVNAYPEINPVWLLTGSGDPIGKTPSGSQLIVGNNNVLSSRSRINFSPDDKIAILEAQLKEKDAQINRLLEIIGKDKVFETQRPLKKDE